MRTIAEKEFLSLVELSAAEAVGLKKFRDWQRVASCCVEDIVRVERKYLGDKNDIRPVVRVLVNSVMEWHDGVAHGEQAVIERVEDSL